jgi:hypothetical protein
MTRQTLLPPNRTPFEEAFDLTGARVDELAVEVPKLVRPFQIPPAHLPWLAWGLSVDLWEPEWAEEQRRTLAARSLPMHARKGTQFSISEHIRIMGGDPRRYIVPPANTFMMEAFTGEERASFLARFPQLRIFPFVARERAVGNSRFLSGPDGPPSAFCGWARVNSRWVRTAKLWDRGEETTLTIRAVTPEGVGAFHAARFDEVILGPKPTKAIHLDAPPKARAFLVDDVGVAQRMIRIPRDASYTYRLGRETYTTAWPRPDLVDVRPQDVAELHPGQPTALYATPRQFIQGKFLPPTISWQYIYERWHIHDPDRIPDVRVRSTHLGYTRLGMPAYNAEVRTRIKGKQAPRTAGLFVNGYLMMGDRKPIAKVREAVRVSKSLRDKILLDTKTWRFPRAGDRLRVGTVTLGRYIAV